MNVQDRERRRSQEGPHAFQAEILGLLTVAVMRGGVLEGESGVQGRRTF